MTEVKVVHRRLLWVCHHYWRDGSTQLDGYLVKQGELQQVAAATQRVLGKIHQHLDITCFGESDRPDDEDEKISAKWEAGGVFLDPSPHGPTSVRTLVVPVMRLSATTVTMALHRFGAEPSQEGWGWQK